MRRLIPAVPTKRTRRTRSRSREASHPTARLGRATLAPVDTRRLNGDPSFTRSLALFPDWWGDDGRYQLLLQFYLVEFCGGLMVGAVGRLVVARSAAMATFGAGLILTVSLAVVGTIGWTTGSVAVMAMAGAPLLPRVIGAVRLARSGPRMGGMLVREGVISAAGSILIGFGYVAGMSAAPNDPPNTLSVHPPIGYIATAIAVYYLILGYFAGNEEGVEDWIESERKR